MREKNTFQPDFAKADLIIRHLKGELDEAGKQELQKWVNEDDRNRLFLEDLENETSFQDELNFFSSLEVSSAWKKVADQTTYGPKFAMATVILKYAAVFILIASAGLLFYTRYSSDKKPFVNPRFVKNTKNDIQPGGDRARLELADGSIMILEEAENGVLKDKNGNQIVKEGGLLVYKPVVGNSAAMAHNKITIPKGGQYAVLLPDGTKVWLNSASSLRFPTSFSGDVREVDLTGEAYFEVASVFRSHGKQKKGKMPFVVNILSEGKQAGRIEVLGTHFNINAYANERVVKTTLLEGAVKVYPAGSFSSLKKGGVLLRPGQQAETRPASEGRSAINVYHVNTEGAVAWKNGMFQFDGADVKTVMRQIERWYDVDVEYAGGIPKNHFTGIISRNTTVSKVLEMLELTGGVQFEIRDKKIRVLNR